MKFQNFYVRVLNVILILIIILFYNVTMQNRQQKASIEKLGTEIAEMKEQQQELLTALQDIYEQREKAAKEAAEKAGEEETEEEEEYYYQNGTYTGSGTGYGGTITVEVTLKKDQFTNIEVISAPGEDGAYLSMGQGIIQQIIGRQTTNLDSVSGATMTSTGILNAVEDALKKAETP